MSMVSTVCYHITNVPKIIAVFLIMVLMTLTSFNAFGLAVAGSLEILLWISNRFLENPIGLCYLP